MSHKGLDFNGNGHVSRTESHMTYNIIRNGAKNSSYSPSSSYRPSGNSSTSSAAKSKENNEIQKPQYKQILLIIFFSTVFVICSLFICYAISEYNQMAESYEWAIEEIKDGDYHWALLRLQKLKEKDFKDSEYLYYYMQSLNTDNSNTASVFLEKIPDDYSGIFSRDIALEKINYIERCENERKIKADKERAEQEANEKKRQEAQKALMPFVGMSTEYINDTRIGKYDEYDTYEGKTKKGRYTIHKYKWLSEDSKNKLVLYVEVRDGVVTEVIKYWEDIYWTKDGKPDFANRIKNSSSSYSSSSKNNSSDDEYDTSRFYWAEDFYDFYYDDFRDFDEAKEYFEEHKER